MGEFTEKWASLAEQFLGRFPLNGGKSRFSIK